MISSLKKRAKLMQDLRCFFYAKGVLEIDVPVIGAHTVTDVFIESLTTQIANQKHYLQTSPEYFMKRLLAEGAGSIFYLGKAFRQDESSARHRPEFTMLEWYRLDFNDQMLMDEMQNLLLELSPTTTITRIEYGELFKSILGCCPHTATIENLHQLAQTHTSFIGKLSTISAYLDLLFSFCVEPKMSRDITFVYHYPKAQAALAKLDFDEQGIHVAKRFEVFWGGVELANGYWELTDPEQQRERFASDIALREQMGLPCPQVDQLFLNAIEKGLPECAGVALGVDRLLMCLSGSDNIAEVLPFADG